MKASIASRLDEFVDQGWAIKGPADLASWHRRLYSLLQSAGEEELLGQLQSLEGKIDHLASEALQTREKQVSCLEGYVLLHGGPEATEATSTNQQVPTKSAVDPTTVFLVHGHDEAAKESVARFLERLSLRVVILHEQPNTGQTVIEKFEMHSQVGFAVVLLTPDDVGASASSPDRLQPRARQNVILELGFFTAKLGRGRVCALFKPGLEVPSDFHGVLLTELDTQGGWRTKLAQELVSAHMQINLQALLQG